MHALTLQEFSEDSEQFDSQVECMGDIDSFCSSSDWILPAAQALMPPREPWIFKEEQCFWAFMRGSHPDGFHYLEPLEAMWALACPVVGTDHKLLIEGLQSLCGRPLPDWKIMALSGMPTEHPLFSEIVSTFAHRLRLGLGQSTTRLIVDLEDGVDGFLSRRSKQFRRSLSRSQKRASQEGISVVDASFVEPAQLFERIMAVEALGWKGLESMGINEGAMHEFYKCMLPRLCARDAQRVLFAQREGQDVAYIFGGLRQSTYRGLQFSYNAEFRTLGLGNILQAEQIRRLCEEGVQSYDLGTFMDYKVRWADREHETVTLLFLRE